MKPEKTIIGAWEQKDNTSGTFERMLKISTAARRVNEVGRFGHTMEYLVRVFDFLFSGFKVAGR
jgi:hypothetical protein